MSTCPTCGFSTGKSSTSDDHHDDNHDEPPVPIRSPAIVELLATNMTPADSDFRELSQKRDAASVQITEMTERIAELLNELGILTMTRQKMKRDLADWKVILHPVRRIPLEILQEIFLACMDDMPETSWQHMYTSLNVREHTPWRLAQVCRQWRMAAIKYPRLWSHIQISIPEAFKFDSRKSKNWAAALGAQIHRSASDPLTISITSLTPIPCSDTLFRVLIPTAPRWKSLAMNMYSKSFYAFLDIRGFLESLTHISITLLDVDGVSTSSLPALLALARIQSIFRLCPRLKAVHGQPKCLSYYSFPSHALVEYQSFSPFLVEYSPVNDNLDLLRTMPNIEDCLILCRKGKEDHVSASIIELRRLQRLIVQDHSESRCISILLGYLRLPALRSLTACTGHLDGRILRSFLYRSRLSQLRHLQIPASGLQDEIFLSVLTILPSLESLVLMGSQELIDPLLTQLHDGPQLGASLHDLTLMGYTSPDMPIIRELRQARLNLYIVVEPLIAEY